MANDFRISGAASTPRSECDIRVNFTDTQKIIAASNAIGGAQAQFYSTDGGATWNQNALQLQPGDSLHADPAVDWTSDGTAWAITIGINASTNLQLRSYKSIDGGATWTFDSTPSGSQTSVDREILWVDHSPTSPFKDQMYLTWHLGVPVQFARRTTGGGAAWQTPIQVSGSETTGVGIGGDVKTNSVGDVFVFWQDADGSRKVYLAKSTDGGVTFPGGVTTIASIFASSRKISIPADSGRKSRVYVAGGAYRAGTKNLVYAAWADLSGESGCASGSGPGTNAASSCKSRIWFARSIDGGSSWSSPVMINNQAGKNDQAFPRLAVDETDGTLVLVYYDTAGDPNRIKTDLYMQTSFDDGVVWGSATKITSAETDETAASADSGNQYGDYIGLSGHAGTFFPAWTDRRNGAKEEIWSAAVKVVRKACAFMVERSTLGQDEIDARRGLPGGAKVPHAFRVIVDGFTAAEIGVTGPGSKLPVASPTAGMNIICTGNTSATGDYLTEVQRFTFDYTLDFGPDDTAFAFAAATEFLTLNVTVGGLSAAADIELVKQPDPFILHGDPPWLSVDLRVFSVEAGAPAKFGATCNDASEAPAYIQKVMAELTSTQGTAGGEAFDSLPTTESGSALHVFPTTVPSGPKVFDFALAKVHYIGKIGAQDVRVFFRLFQAQTTSAAFDPATYPRATNPDGQPIALAGFRSGEYVTIPCFAHDRVNTALVGMDKQTDKPNVQKFTALPNGAEVDHWFGCWLDINQPLTAVLPAVVPANPNGPFTDPANPPLSIEQAIVKNPHQCLIAEIAFDPVPIPAGKDPGNWDKLAQRNLAWSDIANPGVAGSRRALDTFEIRATPTSQLAGLPPDELMIDWGDLPHGSVASIYLPAVDAAAVIHTADRMYGAHRLVRRDDHTIECPTGGITYVPIPAATDVHYAGLLSIDLPIGVRKGQEFSVAVRQVTNASGLPSAPPQGPPKIEIAADAAATFLREIFWRRVLGAFQVAVPVHTKEALLIPEERLLSLLLWIAEAIPPNSRWYLVFGRYLEFVRGRVAGFGGDPSAITPSPTGEGLPGRPHHEPAKEGEEDVSFIGKITGLIFDRYGDFAGFRLGTEDGERSFRAHEHELERLAQRAWKERILIAVVTERHELRRPTSIVLLHAPCPLED